MIRVNLLLQVGILGWIRLIKRRPDDSDGLTAVFDRARKCGSINSPS